MAGHVKAGQLNRTAGPHVAAVVRSLIQPRERQALKAAVAEHGRHGRADAVVVVEHRVHHHARNHAVAHPDIAHIAAALFRGLDLQATHGHAQVAVPDAHILDAAAHLAAHDDAVAERAGAVEHADMARGTRDQVALRILAGLDGNGVVAGIER